MKQLSFKSAAVLLIVAIVLSVGIMYRRTTFNVPYCVNSPVCTGFSKPSGAITQRYYGYPLHYKATSKFTPPGVSTSSQAYYGYSNVEIYLQRFSFVYVLADIAFWFTGLGFLYTQLVPMCLPKKPKPKAKRR